MPGSSASAKSAVKKADCSAKKWFGEDSAKGCKACSKCEEKERERCRLTSFRPNCCKPPRSTPHHVLPKRCFQKGGKCFIPSPEGGTYPYDKDAAPCICVTGAARNKQHGRIHKKFDRAERTAGKKDQTWSYADARKAAGEAVQNEFEECTPECVGAQLDAYHQDELGMTDETRIRANPGGKGPIPRKALSNTAPGLSTRD